MDEGQEGIGDEGKVTSGAWKDGGKEAAIGGARFQGDRMWIMLCIWRPQFSLSGMVAPQAGAGGVRLGKVRGRSGNAEQAQQPQCPEQ